MLEAMGDHEFYCASYSSKDQPQITGLLMTLADGLRSKEQDIAAAKEAGENADGQEVARRILHRLLSSTNRRMHKGFPEMLSYLLRKPMEYTSHKFVHVTLDSLMRLAIATVYTKFDEGLENRQHAKSGKIDDDFMAIESTPTLKCSDYRFRPRALEDFPLYFFISGCCLCKHLGVHSMDWVSIGGQRQRSFRAEPVKSRSMPELPLLDASLKPIHEYDYYVHLVTESPWKVPVLHVKMPGVPDVNAKPYEKGIYALFLMLLFRSHRLVPEIAKPPRAGRGLTTQRISDEEQEEDAWTAVYEEFVRWRTHEIDSVAEPYFQSDPTKHLPQPMLHGNGDDPRRRVWWACMISEKLRNYDAAMRKHQVEAFLVPQDLEVLPTYEQTTPMQHADDDPDSDRNHSNDESMASHASACPNDDGQVECQDTQKNALRIDRQPCVCALWRNAFWLYVGALSHASLASASTER